MSLFLGLSSAFFAAFSTLLFAFEGEAKKSIGAALFRSCATCAFAIASLVLAGRAPTATPAALGYGALSGLFTAAASLFSFLAISSGGSILASYFEKLTLPCSLFASFVFFGDPIGKAALLSFGFIGLSLFISAFDAFSESAGVKKTLACIAFSLAFVLSMTLGGVFATLSLEGGDPFTTFFLRAIFALITAIIIYYIAKKYKTDCAVMPSALGKTTAVFAGLSGGLSWLCYTVCLAQRGYRYTAALEKCSLFFVVGASFLFFGKKPNAASLTALALIGMAIFLIAR